ncbi:hypothetical protein PG987_005197 [Apiospora arundinis]
MTELARRVPVALVGAVIIMPNPGWTYGTGLGKGGGTVAERVIAIPNRILGRTPAAAVYIITASTIFFSPEVYK